MSTFEFFSIILLLIYFSVVLTIAWRGPSVLGKLIAVTVITLALPIFSFFGGRITTHLYESVYPNGPLVRCWDLTGHGKENCVKNSKCEWVSGTDFYGEYETCNYKDQTQAPGLDLFQRNFTDYK